jgi:endonuclease III
VNISTGEQQRRKTLKRPFTYSRPPKSGRKKPFVIDLALKRIEEEIKPYAKAAMFDLAEQGYNGVFQQIVACMISIRTRDEVSLKLALNLLKSAPTAKAMAKMSTEKIAKIIAPATFAWQKAERIQKIAKIAADQFGGDLPADEEVLMNLPGIGPKCAHLTLGVAAKKLFISVDIHVHRVTNRWGYVQAKTPEKTMVKLENKLPREHWIDINRLLVPFGKHVCTGVRPLCSRCPVLEMCQQLGVENPR